MSQPEVSALVTYYGKSPFFAEAFRSVARQSLSVEKFEVVVVTDQPRKDIESEVHPGCPEVVVVSSHEECKGKFMLDGMRSCRGKVVSILNHDDTWEPNKLESVLRAFKENTEVGFYRNGLRWVDERNVERPELAGYRRTGSKGASNRLLMPPYPRAIGAYGLGFNDSSIAISRALVLKQAEFMENVWAAEDTFLLYCAMVANTGLYVDMSPLTRYRVYPGNSSVVNASDRDRAVQALSKEFGRRLQTYRVVDRMVRSSSAATIEPFVARDLAVASLLSSLLEPGSVGTVLSRSVDVLRHGSMVNPSMNMVLAGIGGLRILSTTLPRSLLVTLGF